MRKILITRGKGEAAIKDGEVGGIRKCQKQKWVIAIVMIIIINTYEYA